MVRFLKHTSLMTFVFISTIGFSQCDFINDITGISLTTPPSGVAADPTQFTQVYVLVDDEGNIVATSTTPDFYGLTPALYNIYAVNYENGESATMAAMLAPGEPWSAIEAYSGCIDYTGNYGGCLQSVCDEITAAEDATITNTSSGYETNTNNAQEYCLVCAGTVQDCNTTGTFDLSTYPAAIAGADCEVIAMNYLTADGPPVSAGDNWASATSVLCGECWDYIGHDLILTTILPVEFVNLTGTVEGEWNRIDWSTATETNCDYYVVERSHDGYEFEDIGQVDGAGSSQSLIDYRFFDKDPVNNIEYYRIKQVDYNGESIRTPIVSIVRSDLLQMTVYPNPAQHEIVVNMAAKELSQGSITVLDANGKSLYRSEYACKQGSGCQFVIPVNEFHSGMYCIVVRDNQNERIYKKRFVKQ